MRPPDIECSRSVASVRQASEMKSLALLCLIVILACGLAKPLPIVSAGITFHAPAFGPAPDYYYRPPAVLPPHAYYAHTTQPFGLSYGYGALSLPPVFF